ncbi:hypothetical protein [Amycolatopsis jiangsuensis]|uniref:Uncharacterized protein n=1 Tax=Amycolatopsis jiangsuensis TaxID=1181879 RepID=A0A840J324_9PSEU|nr:hypothetical protein [Amycolatopsis jiangsuensis]MBB4688025.1 hypothetical protein [Amycolatopsis jiangsuensis]
MRKSAVAALAGMAALVLSACGSGGDEGDKVASISSPPSSSAAGDTGGSGGTDADREQAMLKYAKCMRDNGIDMPDPKGDGQGVTIALPGGGGDGKLEKASETCKHFLPNGGEPKKLSPQELDEAREQAKCMREHGVDMPDPNPDGGARMMPGIKAGEQDKFSEAAKACGMGDAAPAAAGGSK